MVSFSDSFQIRHGFYTTWEAFIKKYAIKSAIANTKIYSKLFLVIF